MSVEAPHDVAGAASAPLQRTTLSLSSNWAAPLTYDVLQPHEDGGASATREPVFVGRRELLGSLENAISDPDSRGTYLISGYRGAGKTSLVIEAARRANRRLKSRGHHSLRLVLNSSDVSASLEPAERARTPELRIDARRLLTSLLRALRNRFPEGKARNEADREFARLIARTYEKSEAARYSAKARQVAETSTVRSVETRRSLEIANVLKAVAAVAALSVLGLGGVALLRSSAASIQAACIVLAGVAIISFSTAVHRSRKIAQSTVADTEAEFDNSLHQVESDLKDILDRLAQNKKKVRTLFVLEELDKVDDADGEQLGAVIRYFKNLFTQAPALFFFLTDKEYYDVIDGKMVAARRAGTYAIEHTFFTHRVFVTRPSLDECLDYFKEVLTDPDAGDAVELIRRNAGVRQLPVVKMTPTERFLRVLLFRSQNHLFDLKDEMGGYLEIDDSGPRLVFDEHNMPPEEQVLAAFHFLLEQKATLYRFGGGREYANEILRNCLSSLFADVGSDEPQRVEIVPSSSSDAEHDEANRKVSAQLRRPERTRIAEALDSLIGDLDRGGAIDEHVQSPRGPNERSFSWLPNALTAFAPVPKFEPHEEALREQLLRAIRICGQFGDSGPLRSVVSTSVDADSLASQFQARIEEVRDVSEPLSREDAARRSGQIVRDLAPILTAAHARHQARLVANGWLLSPVGTDGSVQTVTASVESVSVGTLVVYGTDDDRQPLVQGALKSTPPGPVVVVLVDDDPGLTDGQRSSTLARWRAALEPNAAARLVLATMVPLCEGVDRATADQEWGQVTGDEVALGRFWATQGTPSEPSDVGPGLDVGPAWLGIFDHEELRYESLTAAMASWLTQGDPLLAAPVGSGTKLETLSRAFRHAAMASDHPTLLYDPAVSGPIAPLPPDSERRLLEKGRLIPIDPGGPSPPTLSGARQVLTDSIGFLDFTSRGSGEVKMSTLRLSDDVSAVMELADFVADHDLGQAIHLFRTAAERNHHGALRALVSAFVKTGDREAAKEWATRLTATGDWREIKSAADAVARQNDTELAVELYTAAAQAGDTEAMAALVAMPGTSAADSDHWDEELLGKGGAVALHRAAGGLEIREPQRALRFHEAAAKAGDKKSTVEILVRQAASDPNASRANQERLVQLEAWDLLKDAADRLRETDATRAEEIEALLPAPRAQ